MTIFDVPPCSVARLLGSRLDVRPNHIDTLWRAEKGWFLTLCARSALRVILLHLRQTGELPDKNAEVLVPQWICNAAYQTFHKLCFPTNRPTSRLRGVFVYHQYGFPQNMQAIEARCAEEGLFIIENSVNCVESYWDRASGVDRDRRVATIFSFPKMYPVVLGGALQTRRSTLLALVQEQQSSGWAAAWSFWARLLADKARGKPWQEPFAVFQEMAYGVSDLGQHMPLSTYRFLTPERVHTFDAQRRNNYQRLRACLEDTGLLEHLEADVTPFIVPAIAPLPVLERIDRALKEAGVQTGIYHFDVNRNLFEPHFVKAFLVPVHPGLSEEDMDRLGEIIRRAL